MWYTFGFWSLFPLVFVVLMILCMVLCLRKCSGGKGCCCGSHRRM